MNEQEYHSQLASRFSVEYNAKMKNSLKRCNHKALVGFCEHITDKRAKILEVGCNEGIGLQIMKRWGYKNTIGVEYLQTFVKAAQRKSLNVIKGDAHNLQFPDDMFDAIFNRYVLEHCHTPEKVMQEMVRVLKPGGILYTVVSSEVNGVLTRRGSTTFMTIADYEKLIPSNVRMKSLVVEGTTMGWMNIVHVGRKTVIGK
jgi:ubiquinone/menaquinone biosynthesis C-methylase UbiE